MEKFDLKNHLLPVLSKEETKKLFKSYYQGDQESKKKLILHNIRYVYYFVYKYFNKTVRYDELEDLISIGIIGLIKAVETFDISKNYEFITYFNKIILNEILMYLRKRKKWNQVQSLQQVLVQNNNDRDLLLEDTISDNSDFLDDILEKNDLIELKKLFSILNNKEQEALNLYFGLNGKRYHQLEIAKMIGFSQSYTSRIIKNGIQKIKNAYFKNQNIRKKNKLKIMHF